MTISNSTNYIPGNCNIGDDEISKRRWLFYGTALLTFCISVYCIISLKPILSVPYFLLFGIAIVATINYQQYSNKFCIMYGWMGLFNFSGTHQTVVEKEFIKADRKLVFKIVLKSVFVAFALTMLIGLFSNFLF